MTNKTNTGKIEWCDLTVKDATKLKDFYCNVVGWDSNEVSMGDYNDYGINLPESKETIAGICHATGVNKNIPAQWLMYVRVEDVIKSAEQCVKLGGKIIEGSRSIGKDRICIIQDPAGAVLALISD